MQNQQVFQSAKPHAHELPVYAKPTPLDLLDGLGRAAVVLDGRGIVLATNCRAQRLFGDDLRLRDGHLMAADRASNDLLQQLLRHALASSPFERAILPPAVITRQVGRPILVQVLPACGLDKLLGESARALLLLTCLDARPAIPEERLTLLFGLTPAEARLAARLGTGESVEDAADALRISLGTARNQLKVIFAKTETHRQAELVAMLARASRLANGSTSTEGDPPDMAQSASHAGASAI
jgi:DNA-binding CsgD family transcriptional regulator